MQENNQFKPYIAANKVTPEFTVTSIVMGVILAVVFGAANAYLGLRVGMTVSASIPAAVIAMGVIRVIMRKNSILESNIVQTTGSAGESLAAGAIFTLPALYLWAAKKHGCFTIAHSHSTKQVLNLKKPLTAAILFLIQMKKMQK